MDEIAQRQNDILQRKRQSLEHEIAVQAAETARLQALTTRQHVEELIENAYRGAQRRDDVIFALARALADRIDRLSPPAGATPAPEHHDAAS